MDDLMCGTTVPGQMRPITLNQFDPDQLVDLLVFQNHFDGGWVFFPINIRNWYQTFKRYDCSDLFNIFQTRSSMILNYDVPYINYVP